MVFDEAVAGLASAPPVVHLNGSAYAAAMRHGVLTFLLSQLDDDQLATRHELVHSLAHLLEAGGARAIVTLGSPELIDAESATILAQLVAMRKIWLVPVCERLAELPEDMLALYRSGHLSRVSVSSMDIAETRAFLESEVGGTISMFATASLWHLTHSNRDVLRGLVRELVADGKLTLDGDCWVLAPGPLTVGPTATSYGARSMGGLTEGGRRLLSVLAHGGPITSSELRRSGRSDDVGPLRARGLVTVGEAPTGVVSIAVPLLGYVLRNSVNDELREELEIDLERVYPAPRTAQALTGVSALRELGSYEALVATVDEFAEASGFCPEAWRADSVRLGTLVKASVQTLCLLGRHDEAKRTLSRMAAGLTVALRIHPEDPHLAHAAQLLRVRRARIAVEEGRPEAVREYLETPGRINTEASDGRPHATAATEGPKPSTEGTIVGTIWASEAMHLKALAVQAEAWAMASRQQEALVLVQRILSDIGGLQVTGVLEQVMSATECAEIERSVLHVQLLSGEWKAAADVASRLASGRYPDIRSIAYGECVLGLLRGFSGEGDAALGLLLPTLQQLAISGEVMAVSAVEAASAYCLADQDQGPQAVDLLLHKAPLTDRMLPLDFFSWMAEAFSSLAVSRLDTSQAAVARLVALADRAHREVKTSLEINALALSMRLGRTDLAPRLLALCESNAWAGTHGFLLLAQGTITADTALLADGLEHLARRGQTVYAEEDGNVLVAALGHRERRRVFSAVTRARQGEGTMTETASETEHEVENRPTWLDQLTKRESQVAQRVISGMSNSDIARMSGVSVRTVEGHLYQVYSKLQVRNRQELTALDRASRRAVEVQ
ncbi:helix-turn-helix transcriptional regulator [Arthrobacter sp.]|uniref:helix-turn-helix transcriptional regulator n=1 Tax=Arthrobacter sp. TaxID=1667 RepID=UPI003A8D85FE